MVKTASEPAESVPKLDYKGPAPTPTTVPEPPDGLVPFLRSHAAGMLRISVQRNQGAASNTSIGSITVGAEFGKTSTTPVEVFAAGIMAIAQDDFEERVERTRYRVQLFVQKQATGDPKRPVYPFELGGSSGEGVEVSETLPTEGLLDAVMRMNGELHRRVMDLSRGMCSLGEKAIDAQATIFATMQTVAQSQRESDLELASARSEQLVARAAEQKWERGFKLLEELIDKGVGEALAKGITEKFAGKPALTASSASTTAAAASSSPPLPAWASAAAPSTTSSTEAETKETTMELPRLAKKARALSSSLSRSQWIALERHLSPGQRAAVRDLRMVTTDEGAAEVAARFIADWRDEQLEALVDELDAEQVAAILTLRRAALALPAAGSA
jgi:hypothetical protein